jgi:hypothetical protein
MTRKFRNRFYNPIAIAIIILLTFPFAAFADDLNISSTLLSTGGSGTKTVTITAGNAATVTYWLDAKDGDNQNGCNVGDANSNRANVTISAPSEVTVKVGPTTTNSFQLKDCGSTKGVAVSFSSNTS